MQKIVVGMSGGVDSSVAASLLKKNYEVYGVTLHMQGDCFDSHDIEDARKVAEKLSIPFEVVDCTSAFDSIKSYFAESYLVGRTPNPCIMCNPTVKWRALLEYADSIGAEYVATGHYAYIEKLENGRYSLRTADSQKDQTYALCMLGQDALSRTIMPLGSFDKEEVREEARKLGFEISDKPDSMEVCFIPDDDHSGFIERYTGNADVPGDFVDSEGNVLGSHRGITHYTIGQRKGLGIAFGKPMFVKEIRAEGNEVVLGENEELFTDEVLIKDFNLMSLKSLSEGIRAIGKIRYSHKGEKCSIISTDAKAVRIRFDNPVRAVTPGQALVLYDESGYVIGGGIIE